MIEFRPACCIRVKQRLFVFAGIFIVFCSYQVKADNQNSNAIHNIVVGAERSSEYLSLLKKKRVGLLVNPTSMVHDRHLVDFLLSKKIDIKIIFAPEHGFRGNKGAGETVLDGKDRKTNLPIVSLHGKIRKPSEAHLNQLDILIFDIQDVGVRYYTYISSMHYLMEACAEHDVPLIVMDRPNPNGDYIDGPILNLELRSFVGMHPIPIVHGLTVGELAKMINGEGWLASDKQCELTVIKVDNYDHNISYSLPVRPSLNLPNDLAVRLYPSLGFFEATPVSVGRGTPWPFQVLGYPNEAMGGYSFKPESISGSWSELNHAGERLFGQNIAEEIDFATIQKGIDLNYFLNWKEKFSAQDLIFISRPLFLDKLSGSINFRKMLSVNKTSQEIKQSWNNDLVNYQRMRKNYLLYNDGTYFERFKIKKAENE